MSLMCVPRTGNKIMFNLSNNPMSSAYIDVSAVVSPALKWDVGEALSHDL